MVEPKKNVNNGITELSQHPDNAGTRHFQCKPGKFEGDSEKFVRVV
jgi:hypothetical protein